MFKKTFIFLSFTLFLCSFQAVAFTAGKDYQLLKNGKANHKVIEFFSYGCPWCYKLEPSIEKLTTSLPKEIAFERVPVVFEPGWDIYAKAYYALKLLDKSKQLSPVIFKAIQEQNQKLNTPKEMIKFLVQQGIDESTAQSAFYHSPTIETMVKQGMGLMQQYQVYRVPALVVDGKYKTDLMMVDGDEKKLLKVVDYLVKLKG